MATALIPKRKLHKNRKFKKPATQAEKVGIVVGLAVGAVALVVIEKKFNLFAKVGEAITPAKLHVARYFIEDNYILNPEDDYA